MQVIRDGLSLVPSTTSTWPHYLLGMRPGDVLVVFDIRRYETELIRFVEMARAREATIVLFTDQWGSPAAKHADHVLPCRIEVEHTNQSLHAHVELEGGLPIYPGDAVRVHGEPIEVPFGQSATFDRLATVTRAGRLERLWTRLTGDVEFMELLEFSFSDRRTL